MIAETVFVDTCYHLAHFSVWIFVSWKITVYVVVCNLNYLTVALCVVCLVFESACDTILAVDLLPVIVSQLASTFHIRKEVSGFFF